MTLVVLRSGKPGSSSRGRPRGRCGASRAPRKAGRCRATHRQSSIGWRGARQIWPPARAWAVAPKPLAPPPHRDRTTQDDWVCPVMLASFPVRAAHSDYRGSLAWRQLSVDTDGTHGRRRALGSGSWTRLPGPSSPGPAALALDGTRSQAPRPATPDRLLRPLIPAARATALARRPPSGSAPGDRRPWPLAPTTRAGPTVEAHLRRAGGRHCRAP